MTLTPEQAAALRAPFPPDLIGKLPKGGQMLDFVGHGAARDRILSVDPDWSWEPMAKGPDGLPALDEFGNLWIYLTIGGSTKPGCGDGPNMKERIGDAIRNAGMSFGVAIDLWIRGGGEDFEKKEQTRRPRAGKPEPPEDGPVSADNAANLIAKCEALELDPAVVVDRATKSRTDDPTLVLRSEVGAVKKAMDDLVAEKSKPAEKRSAAQIAAEHALKNDDGKAKAADPAA